MPLRPIPETNRPNEISSSQQELLHSLLHLRPPRLNCTFLETMDVESEGEPEFAEEGVGEKEECTWSLTRAGLEPVANFSTARRREGTNEVRVMPWY